jgi:hypothetical protein
LAELKSPKAKASRRIGETEIHDQTLSLFRAGPGG